MIEILDVEQGSDAWYACRAGIPTASAFATIMAQGRSGGPSVTRRKYMLRLIGERMTGQPEETYTNGHMERGKIMGAEARNAYSMIADVEPQLVGFVRNSDVCSPHLVGCSPDSLIGNNGMLELKSKIPSIQLEVLLADEVPSEHIAQLQGNLWVAEREWIDFCSYWPRVNPFIRRVYRDDRYIAAMKIAVSDFMHELLELTMRIAA